LNVGVAAIQGGSKHNAIPREASAIVMLDASQTEELRSVIATLETENRADLGSFDPGLKITVESASRQPQVFANADAKLLAGLLASQHHGVIAMSADIPGLVQNSTNLAIVSMTGGQVKFETSQRSAIEASKLEAARMVSAIFRMAGFDVQQTGSYPGWKPEPNSDIVRTSKAVHEEVLGKKPELMAMHAGLECGVIGEKHPGMQMISFGPTIVDVHSPSEKLKISTVPPFYRFLTALLERI
jgi:dipeptidase D